jgi:hypothetical protein
MRRLLLALALASGSAAGMAACSSASSGGLGPADGGQDTDGTADHADTGARTDATAGGDAGADAASPESGDEGNVAAEAAGQDAPTEANAGDGGAAEGAVTEAGQDGGDDGGSAVDCGASPTLHVDEAGSIYCGFDGVADLYCPTGQECCLGGALGGGAFAAQECAALGATCPNAGVADAGAPAIPIACGQIADCQTNGVLNAVACCLQGATAPSTASCTYPKATLGTAVVCESSDAGTGAQACAAGEVQLCSSQADCPNGRTCTPGKWKIFQVGFCL